MIKNQIKYIALFIILVFIQVLILDNIYIIGYFNAFVYVLFILLLPFYMNKFLVLLLAFLLGFTIDLFSFTPGIHAAASVLTAFIRPFALSLYSPRDGYEINKELGSKTYGNIWFISYALTLITPHHILLFLMEASVLSYMPLAFLKAITSTITTLIFVYLGNLFFVNE